MNVCVMKLNEVTPTDLEEAKKLSKGDRLIFLTDSQGTMSCFLLPLLQSLKIVPEYVVVDGNSIASTIFFMGLQAADINGNYYIISKDEEFSDLNGMAYQHGKNTIKVFVVDNFIKVGTGKSTNTSLPKTQKNKVTKKDKAVAELNLPEITIDSLDKKENSAESTQNITKETSLAIKESSPTEEFDFSVFNLPPAPAIFVKEMSKYGLEKYADILAKCLAEASPKLFMTFEFIVETYVGKERAKSITSCLENDYDSLKLMISKYYKH